MGYNLFIDDERVPSDVTWVRLPDVEWVIARNIREVKNLLKEKGFPDMISFDHDLGYMTPTGADIAMELINEDLDNGTMPCGFTFYVHSMNPVGAENIGRLMSNYLKHKKGK